VLFAAAANGRERFRGISHAGSQCRWKDHAIREPLSSSCRRSNEAIWIPRDFRGWNYAHTSHPFPHECPIHATIATFAILLARMPLELATVAFIVPRALSRRVLVADSRAGLWRMTYVSFFTSTARFPPSSFRMCPFARFASSCSLVSSLYPRTLFSLRSPLCLVSPRSSLLRAIVVRISPSLHVHPNAHTNKSEMVEYCLMSYGYLQVDEASRGDAIYTRSADWQSRIAGSVCSLMISR